MRISYWSSDVCSSDLQWVIGEDTPIPIVPIVVNCFAPPLPSLSRVVAVGHALRDAIAALGTDKRVAIVATGGLRSEEHTSELQSLMSSSYAVFCLKKNKKPYTRYTKTITPIYNAVMRER